MWHSKGITDLRSINQVSWRDWRESSVPLKRRRGPLVSLGKIRREWMTVARPGNWTKVQGSGLKYWRRRVLRPPRVGHFKMRLSLTPPSRCASIPTPYILYFMGILPAPPLVFPLDHLDRLPSLLFPLRQQLTLTLTVTFTFAFIFNTSTINHKPLTNPPISTIQPNHST